MPRVRISAHLTDEEKAALGELLGTLRDARDLMVRGQRIGAALKKVRDTFAPPPKAARPPISKGKCSGCGGSGFRKRGGGIEVCPCAYGSKKR